MSLEMWGENVQQEAYNMWVNHEELQAHSDGVQPFSSPLVPNASLLIVGYNPGEYNGSSERPPMMMQFERGDFSLPESHDYIPGGPEYPVARFYRDIVFQEDDLLASCIETNRYYLRTKGVTEHNTLRREIDQQVVDEYVTFCKDKTAELIDRTDPDTLILFGVGTYESMKADERHGKPKQVSTIYRENGKRLVLRGTLDGRQLIAHHHPSPAGEALTSDEKEVIGETVRDTIGI